MLGLFKSPVNIRPSSRRLVLESLESREMLSLNATLATAVPRIINGTPTNDFGAVAMVGDIYGYYGSGTLIAPQYVLTAAHVAQGVANTAGRVKIGNTVYGTSQVFVYPGYKPSLFGTDQANDLAIYKLSSPVSGVTPIEINRTTPYVGQLLTLVGYGGGGTGDTGSNGDYGTKRVGTTPIDAVSSTLISWNFDNNSESNTAPGDSGGPALVTLGGKYYVAGITSGGDSTTASLGDHSFDTRVDVYASWIDSILAGAAATLPTVSIVAADAAAAETLAGKAANPGSFTITRTGATTSALTVSLAVGGTASNGSDYASIAPTVVIPAGKTSVTVKVSPTDDTLVEPAETVVVSLAASTAYQVQSNRSSASVTIADNDVVRPANDAFASAIAIGAGSVTGSNVNATRESGEPYNANITGGKSVWWKWTATATGQVVINTAGSNFDTTLGVYTGSVVNALRAVAANDDSSGTRQSSVTFNAVAGTTYYVSVDGYRGASGAIKLTVAPKVTANSVFAATTVTTRGADIASFYQPVQNNNARNQIFAAFGSANRR